MATTKAYRTKASAQRAKHNHSAGKATAVWNNASFHGVATPIPFNPRVRNLMPVITHTPPANVIVLRVNPSLDQRAQEPLNEKAAAARDMFAKHRKNN